MRRPRAAGLQFIAGAAAWMALAGAMASAAAPVQVRVSLEPRVIGVDETATLTIEAEGGGIASLRFQPRFTLENLEMIDGPSQFEDLNLINGSLSRSFRYSLRLRPSASGPARVRSLILRLGGELIRLPDQQIRVQEQPTGRSGSAGNGAGAGPAPRPQEPADLFDQVFGGASPLTEEPRNSGPAGFLRAEVQPPQPLVGEQALYTIYLYTRQDVAAINATAMPSFQGFWVRDLPQPVRLTPEMVTFGGERYGRVAMVRKALFALRPGHHVLEPAGCDVVIEPPSRGFFAPPLVGSEELHLRTPELAIEVAPLPSAPPGFGGLVGQVSLAATLQPTSLRLGEGATLSVTLAGAGNLQGVAAPRLTQPPGVTVFPPQQQSEDHLNGITVEGRRTWTFVVVPNRPGRYDLRSQAIAYFDPAHREYRLAEAPPLALTALPPPAAAPTGADAGAPHPIGSAALGDQLPFGWPSLARGWPRLLPWLALPWGVALMVVLAWRRLRPPLGGMAAVTAAPGAPATMDAAPARPVRNEIERRLREAAREDRPRQAAALVENGWRGYLAERWGLPATTPAARWGAVLADQGAGPEVAGEMVRLAEELHYLRYAPQLSTTTAVRDELLARSRQLLRRLR